MSYNNTAMKGVGIGTGIILIGLEALACSSPASNTTPAPIISPTPAQSTPTPTLEKRLYGAVNYSLQTIQTPQGPVETYIASMLSPDGKTMWSVPLDMGSAISYASQVTGGELKATASDFNFKHLATIHDFNEPFDRGIDAVVIGMNHKDYYPSMAFVLDAKTGKELGKVFSPGNITGVKFMYAMETELGYRNALVFTAFSNIGEILEGVSKMTNTPQKDLPLLPAAMGVDPKTFQVFSYKLLSPKAGEADEPNRDGDYFTYRLFTKGVTGATQARILLSDLATIEAMQLAYVYRQRLSLSPKKTSNRMGNQENEFTLGYLSPPSARELRNRSEADMGRKMVSMKARA